MTAVLALLGVLLVALCAAYAAIGHWLDRQQERAEIAAKAAKPGGAS